VCSGSVGTAHLVVRDNGVGMLNVREGSLGYGLVRPLVQQIGGRIETRSESGLTATVSFPASRQTMASGPHA
ncbi:MAG TPA: hypothetical protein VLA19_22325, partial [Herpetosiphonaceae bacterium]|nr:hypothetical protein [Herpetosiphonaceae bacterium]